MFYKLLSLRNIKSTLRSESNKLIKEYVIKNKVMGARCMNAVGFQSREEGVTPQRVMRAS